MEIKCRLNPVVRTYLCRILLEGCLEFSLGVGDDRGNLLSSVSGERDTEIHVDPVLVNERELAVEVKKILVCCSASDNGKQPAVRILLEADVSVCKLLILDIILCLDGKEIPDVFPESGNNRLFPYCNEVSGSARFGSSGGFTCRVFVGLEPLYGVPFALVISAELINRCVACPEGVEIRSVGLDCLLVRVESCRLVIGVSVDADPFVLAVGRECLIDQITVLLILGVFVDDTVIEVLFVPYIICLEYRFSVRKRINKEHDRHHDNQQ